MTLLYSVIYACHANGTHHKLALDALTELSVPDGETWRRLFLKNAKLYLQGSKAPDNEFKDFKNHVLHVRDGYWGGAPEKVVAWYGRVVDALKRREWTEAVYAAGILSHYVTDPLHPFHTGQSDAENNIHRAVEWSISKSYDSLRREGLARHTALAVPLVGSPDWQKELICRAAEFSNRSYEKLIAHYDFTRGVVSPVDGLDKTGRELIAELLVFASRVFAHVLDRAIAEAAVEPPEVELTLETVLATLEIPVKWVTNKLADAAERRQVEAMYDELKALGRVDATLSEDDRTIRDLHQQEVVAPRAARLAEERRRRIAAGPAAQPALATRRARPAAAPAALAGHAPHTTATERPLPAQAAPGAEPVRQATVTRIEAAPEPAQAQRRLYLAATDDVEAAPSIGAKTAEILAAHGVRTVGDLVEADPSALSLRLGDRRFDAETIATWQEQSRLVMSVPGLRGTHAQLLVGSGFRTLATVQAAEPDKLCAAVLAYAASPAGQRILRDGTPPDVERIKSWIESAATAKAA